MKHILRKLHIGSSQDSFDGRPSHDVSAAAAAARVLDGGPQLIRADPVGQIEAASPSTPLTPDQRTSSGFSGWFANARHTRLTSSSSTQSNARSRLDTPTTNAAERITEAQPSTNFNYYEEEYQVQLALALSVSNQSAEDDPEALQIRAAKRISLGRPPSPGNTPAEFTAHRYWNYNVLDYAEKVMDGFYDVYGVVSDFGTSEKMPSLVDLQATPLTDTLGYEVVLVNRTIDQDLVQLEQAALCLAVDCGVSGLTPQHSGLVQKIADLVVQHMGGPVVDANDMLRRWRTRSYELRTTLNNIVLPLGCLQIGLSRHRALLFKVLADHVGIPCRLVKGSHYTGTDEGAVNIVKLDREREYIVDLMGAPGTLLPAEIVGATDVFENTALVEELFSQLDSSQNIYFPHKNPGEAPEQSSSVAKTSTDVLEDCTRSYELSKAGYASKMNKKVDELEDVANPLNVDSESGQHGVTFPEVNAVGSHGSLSGIMTDEFRMIKPALSRSADSNGLSSETSVNVSDVGRVPAAESLAGVSVISEEAIADVVTSSEISQEGPRNQGNFAYSSTEVGSGESGTQIVSKKPSYLVKMSLGEKQYMDRWTEHVNNKGDPVLENVAEWEIPWEEIVIGERIGLGSYGEVHHGDWHGKEVAVKRFLDQDFSGDALDEFISEVRIMRRMQHPNVVLFLGAVTRPPNLSIVTEYLPRGSLFRLLHRPNCQLDERRRLKMALDVAEGMNYLHTSMPIIVHRDLKSPNLLVDKNWVVKVCDFGLSRMKHHTFLSSKSTAGTPEWMAPEVLRNEPSNEKCDVYSFGVILWELATLEVPWSGINPMQVVGAVGFQNRRLEIPKNLDHSVARIIRDCWQSDPSLRPSFSEITVALKPLQRLLKD